MAVQNLADGVIVGIQYLVVALFLVRFGFVAVATGIFVYTLLVSFPITANVSAWYFGTSLSCFVQHRSPGWLCITDDVGGAAFGSGVS